MRNMERVISLQALDVLDINPLQFIDKVTATGHKMNDGNEQEMLSLVEMSFAS